MWAPRVKDFRIALAKAGEPITSATSTTTIQPIPPLEKIRAYFPSSDHRAAPGLDR
jgi:hypothetical protein